MSELMDPENFEMVKKAITELLGFDCSLYSDLFLKRRIDVRLNANTMGSYSGYIRILRSSVEERTRLNKELTIHVTNFFRDSTMWDVFKNKVIPKLADLKRQKGFNSIRIWSAGCSSGEEPLSIAMCFHEALGSSINEFNIRIHGTDLDPQTIEKAKQGLYEDHQFKETPQRYKSKYFDKTQDNLYKAKKDIMGMVQYGVGDVFSKAKLKNLDIIFCRNTVIYFNQDVKSKLYDDFYDCLNSEGILNLGKTEILQGDSREKFKVFDSDERIYLKE